MSLSFLKLAGLQAAGGVSGGIVERNMLGNAGASLTDEAVNIALDASLATIGGHRGSRVADSLIPLPHVKREIAAVKNTLFSMTHQEIAMREMKGTFAANAFIGGVVAETAALAGRAVRRDKPAWS